MFRYRTLFPRIFLSIVAVLFIITVIFNFFVSFMVRRNATNNMKIELQKGCSDIQKAFSDYYETVTTDEALYSYMKNLAEKKEWTLWVTNAYNKLAFEFNYDQRYEKYSALARENWEVISETIFLKNEDSIIYEAEGNYYTPVITCALTIKREDTNVGAIYLHGQVQGIKQTITLIRNCSIVAFLLGVMAALLISFFVARKISKPLYEMNEAAKELSKGNFDQQIEVTESGEIGQLTETFNSMAAALKKYEDTRQSFIGNVSHELKSPLTSIQGFIQGMVDGTISKDEQQTYLEIVLAETKRMNTLIMDLLDLVRIESNQMEIKFTKWDANELIRRCLINFINKIEERHIELTVDISEDKTEVYADIDRITQVITNLLDNAVKFCNDSGSIKVWTYKTNGKLNISISNTGRTIPEEDLEYIFDRFFKVDKAHNRKIPGTGIGLSIVKEIINRHDEKIWVNSKAGVGTVFTFTLALADK